MLPNSSILCSLRLAGAGLALLSTVSLSAQSAPEDTRAPSPRAVRTRVQIAEPLPGGLWVAGDGAQGEGLFALGHALADGPRLGIEYEDTADGMRVVSVEDGSLAASAGLQAGDLLMRIGEVRVNDADDVARALRQHAPNSEVAVHVVRAGQGLVQLTGTLPPPPTPEQPQLADGFRGGFLGVELQTADEAAADADAGVLVKGVVPDSAAWYAGLAEGDRLLAINDQDLASGKDVVGIVSSSEPGALVDLRYRRGGDVLTSRVRLGSRAPAGAALPWMPKGAPGAPLLLRDGQALRLPDMSHLQQLLPRLNELPFFGGNAQAPGLRQRLRLPDGGRTTSLRVEIRDGRMTVDRDGEVKHYERDADGRWMSADGEPLDAGLELEFGDDTNGPRTREG